MKFIRQLVLSHLIIISIMLIGCSSSEETADDQGTPPAVETKKQSEQVQTKPEANVLQKVDTVKVDIQNTQKTQFQPKTLPSDQERPIGIYSVQIGANKMPDNADRIAAIAKERYNINVYTIYDKNDNLYKVMIGDFNTKEEARNFRDEIVKQFPDDYKDAWVSENKQK